MYATSSLFAPRFIVILGLKGTMVAGAGLAVFLNALMIRPTVYGAVIGAFCNGTVLLTVIACCIEIVFVFRVSI
jgi:hypothetical protein